MKICLLNDVMLSRQAFYYKKIYPIGMVAVFKALTLAYLIFMIVRENGFSDNLDHQ